MPTKEAYEEHDPFNCHEPDCVICNDDEGDGDNIYGSPRCPFCDARYLEGDSHDSECPYA